MGCGISKQVIFSTTSETVLAYQDKERCATSGRYVTKHLTDTDETHVFEDSTDDTFDEIIDSRKDVIAAKLKYKEMDVETIKNRFPHWTDEMILDLKAQFQTFDINLDGLIDFQELGHVLNELGDTSDEAARRRYFEELDEDGSGAIDFEEYLALIDAVLSGKSKLNKIGQLCQSGSENAQKLRQLSIVQQIDHGLF